MQIIDTIRITTTVSQKECATYKNHEPFCIYKIQIGSAFMFCNIIRLFYELKSQSNRSDNSAQ